MPSTATSILDGLSTSVAVKAPCRTVATTNITLSGLQTISGYLTVEDDRVLCVGQTTASENGIYSASTGSWTRTKDADGDRDLVQGTRVLVRSTTIDGVEYELTTANPIVIGTTSLTFTLRYGSNATYDQTAAEIAAGVTPTNDEYEELHVFRYASTALVTDILAHGKTVDARLAIQSAINVAVVNGGEVYLPAGGYLINRVAGLDSQFNGIHVPFSNVFGYTDHVSIRGSGRATVLYAGNNSMTVIRWSDSLGRLADLAIDANSKTGITGLSLISSDTANTSLAEHIDWNVFSRVDIRNCAEGIEMENPSGGGCYYNSFMNCTLYSNTRHIRMRDNAQSGGTNRNEFMFVRMHGGNTGVWIDGADTNKFLGCSFEDIAIGTSPSASPTAFYTTSVGSLFGLNSADNQLIGCTAENCTTHLNINNRRISIVGGNMGASPGLIAGTAISDMHIGGDAEYLMRSLQLGSVTVGLRLQPSAVTWSAQPQFSTSSNQGAAYPFNFDGHSIWQGRNSSSADLTIWTGATPTERFRIAGSGHINIISGDWSIGQSAAAAVLTNGATITTTLTTQARVAPGGAVTGIIMEAGTQPGQQIVVTNESAFSVTFAAAGTSNVADGASSIIAALKCAVFWWDSSTSRWYNAS